MPKDKRPGKAKTEPSQPASTNTTNTTNSTQPPSWPPFKPPLPVVDLELESIVKDKVVVLRSFFPRSLCRDYVSFLGTLPLTTTPGKPKRGMALRVNDRFQIQDSAFAHRLWTETGLKEALTQTDMTSLWFVSPPSSHSILPGPRLFSPQDPSPPNENMRERVKSKLTEENQKGRGTDWS